LLSWSAFLRFYQMSRKSARAKKPTKKQESDDDENVEDPGAVALKMVQDAIDLWDKRFIELEKKHQALTDKCVALQKAIEKKEDRVKESKELTVLEQVVRGLQDNVDSQKEAIRFLQDDLKKEHKERVGEYGVWQKLIQNASEKKVAFEKPEEKKHKVSNAVSEKVCNAAMKETIRNDNAMEAMSKNNVVLFNCPDGVLPAEVFTAIGVQCKVAKFYRTSRVKKDGPMVVRLQEQQSVSQIMGRKRLLQSCVDTKLRGIFITKDRSPDVRKKEKLMYAKAKKAVDGNSKVFVQGAVLRPNSFRPPGAMVFDEVMLERSG